MEQTQSDLAEHLRDSFAFLRDSGLAFDAGKRSEAKRLAVTIRVLVHDTAKSRSLLDQLGRKAKLNCYSTPNPYSGTNLLPENRMVMIKATSGPVAKGGGIEFVAPLDDLPLPWTKMSFHDWWDEKVVKDVNNDVIARRQLVLWLANQDGGAHVDPKLDARYALVSRRNALGLSYSDGTSTMTPTGLHLATVRQTAHELEKTLREQLSDLLT